MSLEQMYFFAEIVGVILVLVSLIYLGVQVHQNTKQLKIRSLADATHDFVESFISSYSDEPSAKTFRNGLNGFADLPKDEKAVFQAQMARQFGGFLQVLGLYRNGFLPYPEFIAMERTFLAVLMCPGALQWWQQFNYLLPEETVAFLGTRMAEEKDNIKRVTDALDCFKSG